MPDRLGPEKTFPASKKGNKLGFFFQLDSPLGPAGHFLDPAARPRTHHEDPTRRLPTPRQATTQKQPATKKLNQGAHSSGHSQHPNNSALSLTQPRYQERIINSERKKHLTKKRRPQGSPHQSPLPTTRTPAHQNTKQRKEPLHGEKQKKSSLKHPCFPKKKNATGSERTP